MGTPVFLLQIVEANPPHALVRIPGGGALERELIQVCTDAIVSKGVGIFRTETQVRHAIQDGMTEAILSLKHDTRYVVR